MAWKHLRHPNVLPLLGATLRENRLCLISEWMDQGNINEYLERKEHSEVNRIELVSRNRLFLVRGRNLTGSNFVGYSWRK